MSTIPWTPDDEEARRLLTERIDSYDVDDSIGLWERFLRWLNDALTLDIETSGAGSFVIQALLIVAVVVLVVLLLRYFRPSARPDVDADDRHLVDPAIAAEQYFDNAQHYLASGELDQAYLHAYRFMVRQAQQRQLVEVTPATTATLFGWSLGAVFPNHREAINQASIEFNRVVYGGTMPSHEAVTGLLDLAQTVQTTQPQASNPHQDPARLIPR